MISNFFYPTLLGCTAIVCLAAWLVTAHLSKRYSPQIELTARMPESDDDFVGDRERYHMYLADPCEWSDSGNHSEAAASADVSERTSTRGNQRCPRCRSDHVGKGNLARKAGSTIGAVAGATSGVAMTLSGAEVGATVGLIAGPIGSVFGGLAGAILAGLAASAAGCAAGAAMGEVIDENVLDNHRCAACGHTFSASA